MNRQLTIDEINDVNKDVNVDDIQISKDTVSVKVSDAKKGIIFTDDHRRALSISHKGKIHNVGSKRSDDTKHKISESGKGRVPHNKGIPRTEEEKKLQSKKLKGRATPEDRKVKLASAMMKYIYNTDRGIFYSKLDMNTAYPEYTPSRILYYVKNNQKGFSRKLKE